jgi:hypothetical protein
MMSAAVMSVTTANMAANTKKNSPHLTGFGV